MVSGRTKPAKAKAEGTRERIVDAALELFREKGFDETTMRDIAAAAGVATGAAYYYFRSKEELVMAFYARTAQEAWLVPGDERNIKITTPQDLLLAELLLRRAGTAKMDAR